MYEQNKNNIQIYASFEDTFQKMTDKADRIYHAVFLLTKYVSHKNMNDRLQYLGIDFLEMSYMLHPRDREHHDHVSSELSFVLKELKALTHGVVLQGILNPESKALFDREIDQFVHILHQYVARVKEHHQKEQGIVSPLFDEGFFGGTLDVSFPALGAASGSKDPFRAPGIPPLTSPEKNTKTENNHHTSGTAHGPTSHKGHGQESEQSKGRFSIGQKMNEEQMSVGYKKSSKGQNTLNDTQNSSDKNNRKNVILSFVKKNTEARLKDILTHVSDKSGNCSEKTIQRELGDLIKDGYLKKEGDRRWSKYYFIKDME